MAADIISDWNASQLDASGNSSSIDTLFVTPLDGVTASTSYPTGSSGKWVGTQSGDMVPATAAVIKLTTTLRGRSHRGRVFLPFITETAQTNGKLLTGITGVLQTAWGNFLVALGISGIEWVVASYKLSTAQVVNNVLAEQALGTQRRRQTRYR